jgi:glycosyltransferase involved in cell wall biosynthesis
MIMLALPELSIVIPAYNEAEQIGQSLDRLRQHCEANDWSAEVILVNNSSDDATGAIGQSKQTGWPQLHWIDNGGNKGKGFRYLSETR